MSTSSGDFQSTKVLEALEVVASMKAQAGEVEAQLNNVIVEMNQVYGEAWQSNAADAQAQEFNRIKAQFDKFYTQIDECAEFLRKMTEAKEEADANAASSIIQ